MTIEPGVYVHYKSEEMRYEVLGVGRNTETNEECVVYKPLYEAKDQPDFWIRPIGMFIESVVVDGVRTPRFRRLDD